jgi:predicted O-methyltransferase YrrM
MRTLAIANLIEKAVQEIPGWSPQDQLLALFMLAFGSANTPGDILELGSWCGRSAVPLGLAAKLSGRGKVHCVDLFPERKDWFQNADGTYSLAVTIHGRNVSAYGEQTVWAEPFLRDIAPIYEHFSSILDAFNHAIRANRLMDYVIPYRADLELFSQTISYDFALRLAFIDGDHSYQAVVKDIEIIERFLVPGGWICFDDAFSAYDGVNRAIQERIVDNTHYHNCQQITRKFFVAQRR